MLPVFTNWISRQYLGSGKIIWTGSTGLQEKHVLLDHVFVHQVQGSVSDELVEVPVVILPRLAVARPAARNKHICVYSVADP
jgi:hypothetical protein